MGKFKHLKVKHALKILQAASFWHFVTDSSIQFHFFYDTFIVRVKATFAEWIHASLSYHWPL